MMFGHTFGGATGILEGANAPSCPPPPWIKPCNFMKNQRIKMTLNVGDFNISELIDSRQLNG